MPRRILPLFLTIILTATVGYGSPSSTLEKIGRSDGDNSVRLHCWFNTIPLYTISEKEKRIDLILRQTLVAPDLPLPETDDKLVKILSSTRGDTTTISLFFRYPPRKVATEPAPDVNKLTLSILLDNNFITSQPDVAGCGEPESKSGHREQGTSNPKEASPHAGNWKSFIRDYEAPIRIDPAVQFSLLPFPAISLLGADLGEGSAILPPATTREAGTIPWNDLIPLLVAAINGEGDQEKRKRLMLTYAEVLLRAGNADEAHRQLFILASQSGSEPIGALAQYLLQRLRAEHGDPWLADVELKKLEGSLEKNSPILPWLTLTRIETALATKRFDQMRALLQRTDLAHPADAAPLLTMRQADYHLAAGDYARALELYRPLDQSGILTTNSASLNGFCAALYDQKQFKEAERCYDRLAKDESVNTRQHLGMITFRKVMAQLHQNPKPKLINNFAQIEMTYPNSEAGVRAALKQIDLKLDTLKNYEKQAVGYYHHLAETAENRSIREEAMIKEAVVHRLLDQKGPCVDVLMTFLRDYRNSPLHDTALALLIEVLPDLLKENNRNGRYVETLVLAKKNRQLFINDWIDIRVLADMAEAYHHFGLLNEAARMHHYLLEINTRENDNPHYLPLIRIASEQADSDLVEEYATRYASRYPKGRDLDDILYLRLQNLLTHGKYQEALALAAGRGSREPRFRLLQASLLFHLDDHAKAVAILEELSISETSEDQDALFMLAESAYQLGDTEKAQRLFLALQSNQTRQNQALFRLAEIARQQGQPEKALKLFQQIVETPDDSFWKKLARKELELIKLEK